MFETLSLEQLQAYWWFIIALLGGLFVFMTFVQGGQTLIAQLGKNESQRTLLINALGRKWELTFTTLVLFGGALYAAFPLFYATSFGGAYWVWMAILFCFIVQAVAYEYRTKPGNFLGTKVYDSFLYINGSLGVILIGVAVGTFFTGSAFHLDLMNRTFWDGPAYGLEALLVPFNVALGLMLFFLARIQGMLYFLNAVTNATIEASVRKTLRIDAVLFLLLYLYATGSLMMMEGYSVDPETAAVSITASKYLANLLAMPILGIGFFASGSVLVVAAILMTLFSQSRKGIWLSGIGTVLVGISLFCLAGYNDTAYYPSFSDLQSSLTIANSSGSRYTLTVMGYISLMVPFVLGYIILVWRVMNREPMTVDEVENDKLHY